MINFAWFFLAAALEIAGCFAFWMWLRLGKSMLWVAPGVVSLVLFALVLTRIDAQFAGRAYAAYGGVYIVSSLLWLSVIERSRPVLTDVLGVALCLAGAGIILFGPQLTSG
jgi:small multidrug resistance family-3 protein